MAIMRYYDVKARNVRTNEVLSLGWFSTYERACYAAENEIEFDPEDNPEEWVIWVDRDENNLREV